MAFIADVEPRKVKRYLFSQGVDLTFWGSTQVVLDCEATCGPSVCGIYFNTNRIAFYLEVLPRAISKIRKIRVKRNNAHRSATR